MRHPRCLAAEWAEWTIDLLTKRIKAHGYTSFLRTCCAGLSGRNPSSPKREESPMQTSHWYRGESLTRLFQGAVVGVVATLVVGFGWGGWMLGSSARDLADGNA